MGPLLNGGLPGATSLWENANDKAKVERSLQGSPKLDGNKQQNFWCRPYFGRNLNLEAKSNKSSTKFFFSPHKTDRHFERGVACRNFLPILPPLPGSKL